MPPGRTVQLGSHPGRVFLPLRSGTLTEDALSLMVRRPPAHQHRRSHRRLTPFGGAQTFTDYEDGDIRVYCDAEAAPAAEPGKQAGSVVAVVSCNLNAAPSSSYDFSSVSGCQNWWMRFSAILSVAAKPDLPRSLAPFVTFTPLRSLSADAHNHALGLVNWCAKMKVTHRFGTAADAATGRTELKLQVKDEFGGRAFLLMQDGWAAQGARLQEHDQLIVSAAFLRPLADDPAGLHPSHISYDLVLHEQTSPEARLVVIFPIGTSDPPTVVLSKNTFGRRDLFPQDAAAAAQAAQSQQPQGFVTAAQAARASANQPAAAARSTGSASRRGAAGSGGSGAATGGGRAAKRQRVATPYTYIDLGSLPMHGKHNIYGVISDFRLPRRSKGTDYVLNITLTDPSSADGARASVQIIVYIKPDRLGTCPTQLRIGRILRLHRLTLQSYQGRPQGIVSGSGGVSFALVDGVGDSTEPVEFGVINAAPHSAASNPQAAGTALKSPLDMQKVAALRAWVGSEFFPNIATIKQEYSGTLSTIPTQGTFDLTCLVVGVVGSPRDGATAQELYVWDGTRANFPTRRYSAVQAPGAGRYASCGTVMCLALSSGSAATQAAASHARVGDTLQLKDCRLSDGTAANRWAGAHTGRAICFSFRDTGTCEFGDRCKYAHDDDPGGFGGGGFAQGGAADSGGGGGGGGGSGRSEWHIEFGDFSNLMVLPREMPAVREALDQWSEHLKTHGGAAAAAALAGDSGAAAVAAGQGGGGGGASAAQAGDAGAGNAQGAGGGADGAAAANGGGGQAATTAGLGGATGAAFAAAMRRNARPPSAVHYLMVETPHTSQAQATPLKTILEHPTVPATFRCVVRCPSPPFGLRSRR